MSDSPATSLSLLARARARHAEAWERLVELYAPLVYHWLHRCGLSAEDMADLFQEVFRSVSEHIDTFRREPEGGTFRGWLRTITGNKVRDHFRRRQGEALAQGGTDAQAHLLAVPAPALEEDPSEEGLLQRQVRAVLESMRGEFEPSTWQAFWKVQMESHSPADVAEELGMTPAAVRKSKYRVLRRLREELADLLD